MPNAWGVAIFIGVIVVTAIIWRVTGHSIIDKSLSISAQGIFVGTVAANLHRVKLGWESFGASGAWAWGLAIAHLVAFLTLFFVGLYIDRESATYAANNPYMPYGERIRRYRQGKIWTRNQWLAPISFIVVAMFGFPERPTWSGVVDNFGWLIPYAILIWLTVPVFALLVRVAGADPDDVGENSVACASGLALLIWALPLSHRGLAVLGMNRFLASAVLLLFLLLLILLLIRAAYVVPAAKQGVLPGAQAVRLVVSGLVILGLYLAPLLWNDRPVVHDLTDITGIPLPFL